MGRDADDVYEGRELPRDSSVAGEADSSPRNAMPALYSLALPVILLLVSNVFMTFAWYGHLKYRQAPIFTVILVSWGIAFFEYCFQVPANRIGSYEFSAVQLKTIQEVVTLVAIARSSVFYPRKEQSINNSEC